MSLGSPITANSKILTSSNFLAASKGKNALSPDELFITAIFDLRTGQP